MSSSNLPRLHYILNEGVVHLRVVQYVVRQRILLLNDAFAVSLVVLQAWRAAAAADLHLDLG